MKRVALCFYEPSKVNGIHMVENIRDKLPYGNNEAIYIAIFGNYFGVGIHPLNALLALQKFPKKLTHADLQLWFGTNEKS